MKMFCMLLMFVMYSSTLGAADMGVEGDLYVSGKAGIGTSATLATDLQVGDSLHDKSLSVKSISSTSGNLNITSPVATSSSLTVNGDLNLTAGHQLKINGTDQSCKWTAGNGNDIYRLNGQVGIGANPWCLFSIWKCFNAIGSTGWEIPKFIRVDSENSRRFVLNTAPIGRLGFRAIFPVCLSRAV